MHFSVDWAILVFLLTISCYVVVQFIFIFHCLCCLSWVTWKIVLHETWSVECLSSFSKVTDNAFASVIFRWLSLSCSWWRTEHDKITGKTLQLTCCQTPWNNTLKRMTVSLHYIEHNSTLEIQAKLLNPKRRLDIEFTPNDSVAYLSELLQSEPQADRLCIDSLPFLRRTDSKEWKLVDD